MPLQMAYTLDQLYLNRQYLSSEKQSSIMIKNIDGEIKLIHKAVFKSASTEAKVKYSMLLCSQFIESRIELRTRLDSAETEAWSRNVLVIEAYEGTICLRNFSTKFACSYQLIDHAHLSYIIP
jgi:hypothetical protein